MATAAKKKRKKKAGSNWGGRRPGAGRKPKGEKPMVSHKVRPEIDGRHPVLVTMKTLPEIPPLRAMDKFIKQALLLGAEAEGFRLIHFVILRDHLLLIVEADSTERMSRGLQGLAIRVAWAVNHGMEREKGKVFGDRFEQKVLGTGAEVKGALKEMFGAGKKEQEKGRRKNRSKAVDACSSAPYFFGLEESPLPAPRTRLLKSIKPSDLRG